MTIELTEATKDALYSLCGLYAWLTPTSGTGADVCQPTQWANNRHQHAGIVKPRSLATVEKRAKHRWSFANPSDSEMPSRSAANHISGTTIVTPLVRAEITP